MTAGAAVPETGKEPFTAQEAARRFGTAVQVVEIKLADSEPVQSLLSNVAASVSLLAGLSDEERAALPERVRAGIDALFSAAEGLDCQPPRNSVMYGTVILEWPKAAGDGRIMPGWRTSVFDALTGEPITTASKVRIVDVDASYGVTADLTLLADPDGRPVTGGSTVYPGEDGKIRTGVFRYFVSEMRIRS